MLNIAVCEDIVADMERLKSHISCFFGDFPYSLKTYSDGHQILEDLRSNPFDIIFMDIVLKDANGIDLTAEINRIQPEAQIIYQSHYIEFFKDVYKTDHIYFLLKPIEFGDFQSSMKKALKSIEKSYIVIKNKQKIRCDDIIYIEFINHDKVFHLKNATFVSSRLKTSNLLELLPQSFIRCHKSYIVNIDLISGYMPKKHFKVENNKIIPIGKNYADEVDEKVVRNWSTVLL